MATESEHEVPEEVIPPDYGGLLRFISGPISFLLGDHAPVALGPVFTTYVQGLRRKPWWKRGQYQLMALMLVLAFPWGSLRGAQREWQVGATYLFLLFISGFNAWHHSRRLLTSGTLAHLFLTQIQPKDILLDLRLCILWSSIPATLAWGGLAVTSLNVWAVLLLCGFVRPAVFLGVLAALSVQPRIPWGRIGWNALLLISPVAVLWLEFWLRVPPSLALLLFVTYVMIWITVLLVKYFKWLEAIKNSLEQRAQELIDRQ